MNKATPISIFTALFLGLVLTTVVYAQDYTPLDHLRLNPVFDTLPDGTVIDLSEYPFEKINLNCEPLKSSIKTGKKTFAPRGTSQAKSAGTNSLKSTGLIKSLKNGASSFYTEKLDSIVRYDTYLMPRYDSLKTETTEYKLDENGNVLENITKKKDEQTQDLIYNQKTISEWDITTERLLSQIYYLWDNVGGEWVEESKNEYNYDGNGNRILRLKYSWDLLANEWHLVEKFESAYNENNKILNSKYYDIEKYGEGIVTSKYELTYDDKGAVILYRYYNDWDTELNTWLDQHQQESTYNQDGERTSYSSMTLDLESNEWEYNYKYEYNYLTDGSIEETRYDSWDPDTNKFRSQSYLRYKYDRLYENNKLVQEIKQNWEYDNWEYDWKKIYAYDQWNNQILYELYDPYWGNDGSIMARTIREFADSGQLTKEERYVRDEEYYDLKGDYYHTYQRDNNGKILSTTEYKWDEEKREWIVEYSNKHSYPDEEKEVVDRYNYEVSGYSATYTKGDIIKLSYDASIGRYTGADEDGWGKWVITYNEYLKVDEVICLIEYQRDEKIKCYYNAAGQDTAWYSYNGENGDWEFSSKTTFTYEDLDNGQRKITERSNHYQDDEWNDYYYEDGKKVCDVARWFDDINKEWVLQDSSVYSYNTMGQITSAESVLGENLWKGVCIYANDTLTINTYSKETSNDDWQLEYKDACIVDTDTGVDQYQQVPAAVSDGGLEWIYFDYIFLGYGKILEYVSYEDDGLGEGNINYKEEWFYSEASILSGEAVINGYITNTEQGDMKSVSAANGFQGTPADGIEISLRIRDDDFVLASETTNSEGFYQFLGVPKGTFYLKVELEGYVQNSTHEIQVTDYLTVFEGKNFNISDGTIATSMDETSDNGIRIYPNPTFGKITIETNSPVHSIVIYNMDGIKLAEFTQTSSIDLSHLNKGFYLIQVSTESENKIKKILVK
jgi:hypothetical protein